jgi:FkbM family methyltransferase
VDVTTQARELIPRVLRLLPASYLARLAVKHPDAIAGKVARQGLRRRDVVVTTGLARGLVMNAGASNPDYALGSNEPSVQEALQDLVAVDAVVYDVGANVGFLTLVCARLVGAGGYVYAFEPEFGNAALIRHNLRSNRVSHALVVARAVGASTGTTELQLAGYSGGHVLAGSPPPPDLVAIVPVEAVSLDDFVRLPGARPPDVVKIDVEGAELAVLNGAVELLAAQRPILLMELDDASRAGHDVKSAVLRAWLDDHGYDMARLSDSYVSDSWAISHWVCRPRKAV